jgi:hypothetical protein
MASEGSIAGRGNPDDDFPADCPHRSHCHRTDAVAPDTRGSQQTAEFFSHRCR